VHASWESHGEKLCDTTKALTIVRVT